VWTEANTLIAVSSVNLMTSFCQELAEGVTNLPIKNGKKWIWSKYAILIGCGNSANQNAVKTINFSLLDLKARKSPNAGDKLEIKNC
jgi:hypothetical protein